MHKSICVKNPGMPGSLQCWVRLIPLHYVDGIPMG